jgi:hypothetical protein
MLLLRLASDCDPPASASWVAGTTAMHHYAELKFTLNFLRSLRKHWFQDSDPELMEPNSRAVVKTLTTAPGVARTALMLQKHFSPQMPTVWMVVAVTVTKVAALQLSLLIPRGLKPPVDAPKHRWYWIPHRCENFHLSHQESPLWLFFNVQTSKNTHFGAIIK